MAELTINVTTRNDAQVSLIESFFKSLNVLKSTFSISKDKSSAAKSSNSVSPRTKEFRNKFFGKLNDTRSAEEIKHDIYASRRNKDESELLKAFE